MIRVGCAVLAVDRNRLLLGKRGKEPFYGRWVLPGGGIQRFETFEDAAKRELMEETGLTIKVESTAKIAQIIAPPDEHRVIIYVWANIVGGELTAKSDLLDAELFDREGVQQLARDDMLTPTVQSVLNELGWLDPKSAPKNKKQLAGHLNAA